MSISLERKRKATLYVVISITTAGVAATVWHFRHALKIAGAGTLDVWMDVLLGTALLAIVPFAMAAYGGHVAAESISDPKRRRNVKLKFWAICLVGVGLAFIQQYRAITSDAASRKKTNQVEGAILGQLQSLHSQATLSPEQAEMKRREDIVTMLRGQYILQHDNVSPGVLEGTEPLPADWLNRKVHELGEKWNVSEQTKILESPKIIQQVLSEPKKTEIQIGFYDNESESMSSEKEISLPSEDGFTVRVPVTARAVGDVTAKNGSLWFRVCNTCNWAKEPDGFGPKDNGKPKDRSITFGTMFPNVILPRMQLEIMTPIFPRNDAFTIYTYYACENCPPLDTSKPQVLAVRVTHPKQQKR
jgi:hypothetical protein